MSRFPRSLAVALTAMALAACSDETTAPVSVENEPEFSTGASQKALATVAWHEQARALVGSRSLNPVAAQRVYAALAVAQYTAINEVRHRQRKNAGYSATERGAVAGASQVVLTYFFATASDVINQQVQAERELVGDRKQAHFDRGIAIGSGTGTKMTERLAADHFTDPWTGTVPVGTGVWRNNGPPAGPLWGKVTPYLLRSGDQFRPAPPPAFGSTAFLTDLNEISRLSATRTPEQLASAQFWNYPNGTPTPPGYWNEVASDLITRYRLRERAAAHVYALMHAAGMDAMIGCWDAKYTYWYIRPSQADATITLPIGLPNHPSYPSGHSCVSSASGTVLSYFFPKQARSLADQVEQAGLSRMYAGIHYRFDITAGATLGKSVAGWAIRADRRDGLLNAIRRADRARAPATLP